MDLAETSIDDRRRGVERLRVGDVRLESGEMLRDVGVAYRTFGDPANAADGAVYICHSLSADCHVIDPPYTPGEGWWERFVGAGKVIDLDRCFVVCSNFLGGCFGTTGPGSVDPATGHRYGSSFPIITMGDVVRVKRLLLEGLGIDRLHAVVGGSFGGAQALQMVRDNPGFARSAIVLAANARTSVFARGINGLARWAIEADARFNLGDYSEDEAPTEGLALARAILEHSFVDAATLAERFGDGPAPPRGALGRETAVSGFLRAKGAKFAGAYDANTFHRVTHILDRYDLGDAHELARSFRGAVERALLLAVSTDAYFPEREFGDLRRGLAAAGVDVAYHTVSSPIGHDAFFKDVDQLGPVLGAFLRLN